MHAQQRSSSVTGCGRVGPLTAVPFLSGALVDTPPTTAPSVGWPEPRPLAWRLLARLDWATRISRLSGAQRDAVLLFHSVGGVPGTDYQWDMPVAQFRAILRCLSERFEIVSLDTLTDDQSSDGKRVALTFDDAFRNIYHRAVPLLRELNLPATVFVNPLFIGDNHPERIRDRLGIDSGAREIIMTEKQLWNLADDPLFALGNHTASHANLTDVNEETLHEEILGGKQDIEDRFGVSVNQFAYPYGAVNERAAGIVSESHALATISTPSLVPEPVEPMWIPRIDACQPAPVACFEVSDLSARLRRLVRTVRL